MAEDEESGIVKRLLGEEMQRTFWELHARDYLGEADIAYLRTTYCMDTHIQRQLYDLQEHWEPNDGIQEPGADLVFLREFWALLEREYSELLRKLDPLSRASALAARPERWYRPWPIFSDQLWTSWVKPGNDGYVYGRKGTGKTDFMCKLGELFIATGGTVVGGIPLNQEREGYVYCTRGSQLLRMACQLMLQDLPSFVLFDEGFLHASGETPLDVTVLHTRQFARVFRKLGIASLWGSQRESDILKDIRIEAAFRAHKRSKVRKDYVHVQITAEFAQRTPEMQEGRIRVHEFSDFVKWVPPTTLPFATDKPSAFVMDFEPAQLLDFLADLDMEENQFRATLEWLDGERLVFSPDEKRYLARKIKEAIPKATQRQIASIVGVTRMSVSRYLRS